MKETARVTLEKMILESERERVLKWESLREHFVLTSESLKPLSILKNSLLQLVSSPETKTTISKVIAGKVAGSISKTLLVGNSKSTMLRLSGTLLEMLVDFKTANNSDEILLFGKFLKAKMLAQFQKNKINNGSPA